MLNIKVNKDTIADDIFLDLKSFIKSNNNYRLDGNFNFYVFNNESKLFESKGHYKDNLKVIYEERYVHKNTYVYYSSIKYSQDGSTKEINRQISPAEKMFNVVGLFVDNNIINVIKPLNSLNGIAVNNKFIYLNSDNKVIIEDLSIEHEQITKSNIEYNKDAECPIWNNFLNSVFDGDNDNNEKIEYIQNYLGACLFGQAYRTQKSLILFGAGANGKSVLVDTVAKIFNRKKTNIPAATISSMLDSGKGAREYARSYLNIDSDMSARAIDDSSVIKKVITGDSLEARQLYRQDTFEFSPIAGNMFCMNQFPQFKDDGDAVSRRLTIVNFNNKFEGSKRDNLLCDKLNKELPGILNWIVEGGKKVVDMKFNLPNLKSSDEEFEDMKSINPMKQYIDQLIKSNNQILLSDLYNDYIKYYKKITGKESNNLLKAFSRELKNNKIESKRTNKGIVFYCSIINNNSINASSDPVEDELSKIDMSES